MLAGYVRMHGGEIGALAPNLGRRLAHAPAPQSSDPETERFMLFKAVADLLRAVTASVPLCIVLDDFHWADGQSVALLKHVARNVEHGAIQLLVTYRDTDLTKSHPLTGVLADLRRLEGVERVALHGLTSEDVRAMTEAAAGHELDSDGAALAGEIAAETDGNPFFVGEILRNLSDSGMVVFDEARGRWEVDRSSGVALPESVREVVERRVDVLGAGVRETLTAAAVTGRTFDLELLTQLVEPEEPELLVHLEAAVTASLLVESTDRVGRFTFAHALINHTLYQALGPTRRARMHLRVAEALEERHGGDPDAQVAELALHWRLATVSVDTTKAAGYTLRAGRQALDRLAPSEAAKLFGDALELLGPDDTAERCEALIGLGEAQRLTGEARTATPCWRRRGSPHSSRTPTARRGRRSPTTVAWSASLAIPMRSGSRRSNARSSSTSHRNTRAACSCCRWRRSSGCTSSTQRAAGRSPARRSCSLVQPETRASRPRSWSGRGRR